MMEIINDWKRKNNNKSEMYFFIEKLCEGAMRICIASNIEEAIRKFDEIGLKYGYKTDITKITVKSGDEILNIGTVI